MKMIQWLSMIKKEISMFKIGCHLSSSKGYVAMGKEAVKIGLIDEIGGLSDALDALREMISERK